MRREELKNFCLNKLQSIESILNDVEMTPITRLRLITKKNVLKNLVDYETCFHFYSIEDIAKYIEDAADIVCGFYEH